MSESDNQLDLLSQLSVPRYAPRLKPTAIPTARWDDEPLLCLKVNDEWVSHLLGVIVALDQGDTWLGTADQIRDARQQVNEIMLAFMEDCNPMDNCCPEPNRTRINGDGTMEVSYDGGLTWQDGSDFDPRLTSPQFPPLEGEPSDQKRCDAAANVAFHFEAHATQIENDATLFASLSALVAAFVTLLIFLTAISLGTLTPIIMGLAAALLTGGQSAFTAAMTAEVWVAFNCIIYCHMDNNGQLTESDISEIVNDINDQLTGIAALYLSKTVLFMGVVGLNNMASTSTGTEGNCVDCECPETCAHSWQIREGIESVLGHIVEQTDDYVIAESTGNIGAAYYIDLTTTFAGSADVCCYMTSFEILESSSTVGLAACVCGTFGDPVITIATEGCFTRLQPQSAAYFKIKFNFAECPP